MLTGALFQRPPLISAVKRVLRVRTIYKYVKAICAREQPNTYISHSNSIGASCLNMIPIDTWVYFGWIVRPARIFVHCAYIWAWFWEWVAIWKSLDACVRVT